MNLLARLPKLSQRNVLFEGDTALGHYQIVDTVYENRPSRVLYGGAGRAPQSGVAFDDNPDMLFDYNQRFLELAEGLQPERVLVVGGGCYTLPMALLKALPSARIDVVEPDAELEKLARRFFGLRADGRLNIFHSGGREHLEECNTLYDLIIIDAFEGADIPEELLSKRMAELLHEHLQPGGTAAMNIISAYRGPGAGLLGRSYRHYVAELQTVQVFPAGDELPLGQSQNFIVTARKNNSRPIDCLRLKTLPPPE